MGISCFSARTMRWSSVLWPHRSPKAKMQELAVKLTSRFPLVARVDNGVHGANRGAGGVGRRAGRLYLSALEATGDGGRTWTTLPSTTSTRDVLVAAASSSARFRARS